MGHLIPIQHSSNSEYCIHGHNLRPKPKFRKPQKLGVPRSPTKFTHNPPCRRTPFLRLIWIANEQPAVVQTYTHIHTCTQTCTRRTLPRVTPSHLGLRWRKSFPFLPRGLIKRKEIRKFCINFLLVYKVALEKLKRKEYLFIKMFFSFFHFFLCEIEHYNATGGVVSLVYFFSSLPPLFFLYRKDKNWKRVRDVLEIRTWNRISILK